MQMRGWTFPKIWPWRFPLTRCAKDNWEGFPPSARRGILEWILNAKTAPPRQKRILETAEKAARGELANQWR